MTNGDSGWAGGADRLSVSGTASWLRGKLGWFPNTASSSKRSTIALSSGEAELVAALSGPCEGMSLRQQRNWLLKFRCNAEEMNAFNSICLVLRVDPLRFIIPSAAEESQHRICCVVSFFLQQWSARPGVRLVQVVTREMLADCLTKRQSTPNSVHLSRLGLDIKSGPKQI